jgi:uncharacterized protein YecE (DUF72 family)
MELHVGTSGWSYDHWEGIVYPPRAPQRERLDYYVRRFQTVEVNATYYRWPADTVFAGWRERTPEGFRLTVKAPRGLTHVARLQRPEEWLARVEDGLRELREKLGVLLVQLPPSLEYDYPLLDYFLEKTPSWIPTAVEFRHPSWHQQEETFALLERHGAAYCVMSGAHLPCILRATAPFVYVRLHGPDPNHLYGGSYSDEDMRWWAERIREWGAQGRAAWAYFNNDWEGNAVRNAETLLRLFGE